MATSAAVFDLYVELRRTGSDFESVVGDLRPTGAAMSRGRGADARGRGADARGRRDRGVTPRNLSVALPFHLIEGFPFHGDLPAARVLSLANAFGAAHFLAQDRVLDGDEKTSPRGCALSDLCLWQFTKLHAALLADNTEFWGHVERYLREYFDSLAWERDVLWGDGGGSEVDPTALADTLRMLGRKIAPLKASVAAVSLLSGTASLRDKGEGLVEAYHAAYQLVDDLDDLSEDATRGHRSVPLRMLEARAPLDTPLCELTQSELVEVAAASGVYREITELASERYESALALSAELGLDSLTEHLREDLDAVLDAGVWVTRRAAVAAAARPSAEEGDAPSSEERSACGERDARSFESGRPSPTNVLDGLHVFSVADTRFLVDPESCLFFEADGLAADTLDWVLKGSTSEGRRVLEMDHGPGPVREALKEIAVFSTPSAVCGRGAARRIGAVAPRNVVSLALNVTSRCNLGCDYCYLGRPSSSSPGMMSEETALKALELLFAESHGEREASLVFFGGEPLLEGEFVMDVAGRAREEARDRGMRLSLHVTTNGTTLTPDLARGLHALGVSVLVSIDGPAVVHDAHRCFRDGRGSHDIVARNLRSLPSGMSVSARATVTPGSAPLVDIVSHMKGLGVDVVHLSGVSGACWPDGFASRLADEFEELAVVEVEALLHGSRPVVGNFARVMRALAEGRPRSLPCGAGFRYLCAAPDGTLYLCHRFAGNSSYEVGSVHSGVDRKAVRSALGGFTFGASVCHSCWARFLCGGPCLYDQSVEGVAGGAHGARCHVTKRMFELSMWMFASLPEKTKRGLLARAGRTDQWEGGW